MPGYDFYCYFYDFSGNPLRPGYLKEFDGVYSCLIFSLKARSMANYGVILKYFPYNYENSYLIGSRLYMQDRKFDIIFSVSREGHIRMISELVVPYPTEQYLLGGVIFCFL
ncbi:hypothetical protein RF11_02330 [Thelohanellus kitauei]|uniref:Uncharacterized protein n=1 Tax=Thelohanellus kitauei TaxID=669202 RepID=A0A0C2MKX1_THEKT|nr:hypothetical protein RF11_02330 [Thelohanellus kitauei]